MSFNLRSKFNVAILVTAVFVIAGCKGRGKNGGGDTITVDTTMLEQKIFENISNAKRIFYSLPSPLESAKLINSAGAVYNEALLNPITNAGKYTTDRAMALNLGIYITDLSYASLFNQPQATLKYMEVAKKMADGLGITDAIDKHTINRLEENINNRDVILDIISETFMSSTAFLSENERQPLATVSLVGGWIEGLYLSTQLVENEAEIVGNKIVDRVVDMKLSLDMVLKLIESNNTNNDVKEITPYIMELKEVYDKITLETSKIQTEVDPSTNVTTLKSTSKSNITKEVFIELKETVKKIRTSFTL